MKLKFLGTGTSQGDPVIGSDHPVCLSTNLKDKRLRSSAIITTDTQHKILIDCGPDFRQQMLSNNEKNCHAVLITHEHNDHIIGLDDMRPLIFKNQKDMPIYCEARVYQSILQRFAYAFEENRYPGAPSFDINIIENKTFNLLGTTVTPIRILHGGLPILGYKFKNIAYITDCKTIPEEEKHKLKKLKYLIINCLRKEREHHSHLILPNVIKIVEELQPQKTYLTHISHDFGFHNEIEKELSNNIHLAFDGLEIDF